MFRKKISRITIDTLSNLCIEEPMEQSIHKFEEEVRPNNTNNKVISLNIDLSELDFESNISHVEIIDKPTPSNIQIKKESVKNFTWL